MSNNLKFQIDGESDVETIRSHLLEFSAYAKISALSLVNEENIAHLIDEVKICAYDYRPVVRIYAYKALAYAKSSLLTELLKDALRDEDGDAFKAARELHENLKNNS